MADFDIRVFAPPAAFLDPAKLTKVIENTLDEAALGIQADFKKTVFTWEHKPDFRIDYYPGKRIIYTDGEIYGYVSHGTPPHIIRPKNAKRLHFFRTGFRAKSRPNSLAANKGAKASKDETFAGVVHHPGTAARNFDIQIQKRWRKYFPKQAQAAIDAAFGKL